MEAERQRILEVNDQTAAKQARCEEERIAMNAEFTMRRRFVQRAAPFAGRMMARSWDIAPAYTRRVGGLFIF
jgi:hypothetical protein